MTSATLADSVESVKIGELLLDAIIEDAKIVREKPATAAPSAAKMLQVTGTIRVVTRSVAAEEFVLSSFCARGGD